MFGIVIISKRKLEQLKNSAYHSGFQTARSVGFVPPTPPSNGRNTQTANTSVQEAVHDMHKRVDAAQKQVAAGKKRRRRESVRGSYADPSLRLIANGADVEDYVFKNIGKLTQAEMAKNIVRNMGTYVKGYTLPIKVNSKLIGHLLHRRLVYDEGTNLFLNVYSRNRNH
jgi:hypothetical protein